MRGRKVVTGSNASVCHNDELVEHFYRSGFVVLDNGEALQDIEGVKREFDDLLVQSRLLHHQYENGFYAAINNAEVSSQPSRYPLLTKFLQDRHIRTVIKEYLARFLSSRPVIESTKVHEQLDLEVNSRPGRTPNSDWHFDRMPSVKTCLFLSDARDEPLSFQIIPGSHFVGRKISLEFLRKNPDPLYVDNFLDIGSPIDPVTFSIRPGMLVLFDTLAVHRGGIIQGSGERKAIRTVTWPPILSTEYFTAQPSDSSTIPYLRYTTSHPFDRAGQRMEDRRHIFVG